MTKTIGLLFILILIIFTASCNNQSILVDIDVPEQSSISLEKQVFLKITPEFENFIYRHPYEHSLSIKIGAAQSLVFKKTMKKVFFLVQTEEPSSKDDSTIMITPKLTNIEISKPEESGLTSYECRLEYSMEIKSRKYAINHNVLAYSTTPSNKNQSRDVSALMSQCLRKIASKLEIKLLELTSEV